MMFYFLTATLIAGFVSSAAQAESSSSAYQHDNVSDSSDYNISASCEAGEKCVPYYFCGRTDGAEIFNIRSNLDENVLACESLRECCEIENIKEEVPALDVITECGYRNADGLGYFAYGRQSEAQFGEFPWMMAVLKQFLHGETHIQVYFGGGSLIHPSVVLTAAHIIVGTNASDLSVRGGEWNARSNDEMLPHVDISVTQFVLHDQFTRSNLQNDVAMMFLSQPFKTAPHINTICLPQPKYQHKRSGCFSSGWGKEQFGLKGSYQVFLKKVELPIVDSATCQEQLRRTRLGEDFLLHDGFLCAGGVKGQDTCTGDGGSPLVCPIPGQSEYFYQAGIVVGGIGCGDKDVPAFYVDVFKYMPWIRSNADAHGIEL